MAAHTTRPPFDENQHRREVEASRAAYQARISRDQRLRVAALGLATAIALTAALALAKAFGG
jgi:hypothetical protein